MKKPWTYPREQQISSADTSINCTRAPAVFRKVKFVPGTVNADIGGGRCHVQTKLLAKKKVTNVVYDPFNRPRAENTKAVTKICCGRATTATIARARVIDQAADAVGKTGTAYFQIYEGSKSGRGAVTTKGWQENRKTASYVAEIKKKFSDVRVRGNVIEAKK